MECFATKIAAAADGGGSCVCRESEHRSTRCGGARPLGASQMKIWTIPGRRNQSNTRVLSYGQLMGSGVVLERSSTRDPRESPMGRNARSGRMDLQSLSPEGP